MSQPLTPWTVTAVNLPEHADNTIHTDVGAQAAGFPGALVAGVTTYAYLTHLPASAWGDDWLAGGEAAVRFLRPVLDGDRVEVQPVEDVGVAAVVDGERRALATFTRTASPMPPQRGAPLAPVGFDLDASWSDYGHRAGDDLAVYAAEQLAHPSSWLRVANQFCHEQLVDGPWIHARSRVVHLGLARVGAEVHATAEVVDRFPSRAGERAVLDVRISADGRPVASVEHEAIIALAG